MERYEQLAVVGEGSYGVVLKCRHRDSDQIVAIKKFLETEEDAGARKMALREIRMLKKLRHENLVTMIEVFRHRKRFYLVFEYVEGTVLDELERSPGGLGEDKCKERIFQVTRAISYCHSNNIIHRDVKPENVLVSSLGVVKLCDFGFARLVSINGDPCTEYVATRWYRAPELLVGEQQYGSSVDVWAIGCLYAEMMTGEPLFPGESDIDQLYLIVKSIGKPCARHQQLMARNSQLRGMIRSAGPEYSGLYKSFGMWPLLSLDYLIACLRMDPQARPSAEDLLRHNYFTHDKFPHRFLPLLREHVNSEFNSNPLLRKYKTEILMSTDKKDESKTRRLPPGEQPRWRLSLIEGSVKRKFSDGTVEALSRPMLKTYAQKTGLTFLKQAGRDRVKVNSNEALNEAPSTEDKTEPPTPSPKYQSLQSFDFPAKTFKEPQKKSPNILQSIHNTSIKGTFNQVPLITAPRNSFVKKLERNVVVDNNMFVNIEPLNLGHPPWSHLAGKRKEPKKDTFTLPNLPGATTTPQKTKPRPAPSPDPTVTPRISSSMSPKTGSTKNLSNILPIV